MTEEGAALDAADPKHHLFWCKKCEAPVRTSGWRGPVTIACAACGFEENRDIRVARRAQEATTTGLYRDAPPAKELGLKVLKVDINGIPEGHDVAALDAGKLRAAIAKMSKVPEGRKPVEWRGACEWEATWIAVWLALHHAVAGDRLSARIALETALDATDTPEYRALLLAHLAQHAGSHRAAGARLAKRWLAACPAVEIAELESEIRAARAMLALAQDKLWDVIDMTGGNVAGRGYVGTAMFLAIALNVEASDRRGDWVVADAIMRSARKQHMMPVLLLWISAFDLAKAGLARMNLWVQKWDAGGAAAAAALAIGAVALGWGRMDVGNALLVVLAGALGAWGTCWATFRQRAFTRNGRAFRIATSGMIVLTIACIAAFALVR